MSLTRLIKAGRGPVWSWFAENFPETQRVSTLANRELRGGDSDKPCAMPAVPGADRGLVGTAVGYVLSAHLRADALDRTVARAGALELDRPLRKATIRPSAIERQVVATIANMRPWARHLTQAQWDEMARLTGVLARFEQYVRAGSVVLPYLDAPVRKYDGQLDELAAALVSAPTVADIARLGRCSVEDHLFIRDAKDLHIGPAFRESLMLGGADADLIYDGTLLDLKSTASPGILKRRSLWQGLGYLLADSDDSYHIHTVGFSALRWRRSIYWPAQELIDALAGGPSAPIAVWRAEFVAVLADDTAVLPLPRQRFGQ